MTTFVQVLILETLALVGLILVSFIWRKTPRGSTLKNVPRLVRLALRHPFIIYVLMGFLAFTASALLTIFPGIPEPLVHDEFSYLLAADTFAHGRLTNPPHPLWKYFETMHVIQQPTYASKYPPAQGLALAFGQVFFGHPIVGVWLSVGLACAAISWMIAGWCPLRWAWLGGLIALVRIVFSGPAKEFFPASMFYWSQSFWGGAVAALGGALVFGALPRIMKTQKLRDALWLVLGLAILVNSRPLEGLVVSIPALVVLAGWIVKSRSLGWAILGRRVVLPIVLVLLLTASWMAYYNFRVTGKPFRLPYQVHEAAYAVTPPFLWLPLQPEPPYNHKLLRDFYKSYVFEYFSQQSFSGFVHAAFWKIIFLWLFFIGIFFTPFMTALLWIFRRRSVKLALVTSALLIIILVMETWNFPHYAAPAASLFFLLVAESLRRTRRFTWRARPVGYFLVHLAVPFLLVSASLSYALTEYEKPGYWHVERARILRNLEQRQERFLVLIRYGKNHSPHFQWIYNRADIDNAKVVWAWDMNPQGNKELLDYFKDRRVLRLNVK